MSIRRLVVITMSDDYGTGYRGNYDKDDSSEQRTRELTEELLNSTVEKHYAITYADGLKVPWLVNIIETVLEPETLTCEKTLLLKSDDEESLLLMLTDLIEIQKKIKREPCTLIVVAYYPKYESPPFVDLGDGWYGYKVSGGRSMIWAEYVKSTRA